MVPLLYFAASSTMHDDAVLTACSGFRPGERQGWAGGEPVASPPGSQMLHASMTRPRRSHIALRVASEKGVPSFAAAPSVPITAALVIHTPTAKMPRKEELRNRSRAPRVAPVPVCSSQASFEQNQATSPAVEQQRREAVRRPHGT